MRKIKTNFILCDCRISIKCLSKLKELGKIPILMPPFSKLSESVASHPDMLIFPGGDCLYTHRDYYKENKSLFDSLPVKAVTTDEYINSTYPDDILFNAFAIGGRVFGKKDKITKLIKSEVVNVNQGYSKCSTAVISDSAIITEDKGIAKRALEFGIDVLAVESGHVNLSPFEYGFLGGASGLIDEGVIAFCGDVKLHPEYSSIFNFCNKHKVQIISLSDEKLYDYGSLISI